MLTQTAKGFILGETGKKDKWKSHVFHVHDSQGRKRKLHGFIRIEFQDGIRKKASKSDPLGSGRPHVHMLIFGDDEVFEHVDMPTQVSATEPSDPDLQNYVQGSQFDHDDLSGHEVNEAHTFYDADKKIWRLHHKQADHDNGLRGYIVDIMDALKCHQSFDIIQSDQQARFAQNYLSKYLSKLSNAASDEWLDDDQEANTMAVMMCMRYRPFEPEMILQLFGSKYRQWHLTTVSGGKRDFRVPLPDQESLPKEVKQYMEASWARGRISLLDFLRKTTNEGTICHWLKKLHKTSGSDMSLGEWAAQYQMQGEKVVAPEMNTRRQDKFYGQWLVLNKPFHDLAEFTNRPELEKVPEQMKYMAMAMLQGYGEDVDALRRELLVEGHGNAATQEFLDMVASQRVMVQDYIAGRIVAMPDADLVEAEDDQGERKKIKYTGPQKRFAKLLGESVDRAMAYHKAVREEDEQQQDKLRKEALDRKNNKILICWGPGGSGKTTVVHKKITEVLDQGGSVAFGLPTAQLSSRMKKKYRKALRSLQENPGRGRLLIDTCHAIFALNEDLTHSHAPLLAGFDLVVIDEVSQLNGQQTDKIIDLWEMSECVCALTMIGDKWQMAGMGETRPWKTRKWKRSTFKTDFDKCWRSDGDPFFQKLLKRIRKGKPTPAMMKFLKKRRAWNPPGPPTSDKLRKLLHAHPNTEILACTRKGVCEVNDCALQALYPSGEPLATIAGDVESNPANYAKSDDCTCSAMKPSKDLEPLQVPVFKGMNLYHGWSLFAFLFLFENMFFAWESTGVSFLHPC